MTRSLYPLPKSSRRGSHVRPFCNVVAAGIQQLFITSENQPRRSLLETPITRPEANRCERYHSLAVVAQFQDRRFVQWKAARCDEPA